MKKIILTFIMLFILFGCNNSSKFKFEGHWKSDLGPNFGMPSTLIITKEDNGFNITLDNKKFTGVLNDKNGQLIFAGYTLEYDENEDEIILLPFNSVYKRE